MKSQNLREKEALAKIEQEDKRRADNYRYYTNQLWGNSANYNISIDTSLGENYVTDLIISALEQKKQLNNNI